MKTQNKFTGLLVALILVSSVVIGGQALAQDSDDGCPPALKADLEKKLKATADTRAKGKKAYEANCVSCHGDKGLGDGVAGKVLNPPPRNFSKDQFKNGMSPINLFDTITNGLEGTSMPGFDSLPEDDRWAIMHYLREDLMPKERRQDLKPGQLDDICISIAEERNRQPPIPVELAMQVLAEETKASWGKASDYGPVKLSAKVANESAKVPQEVLEQGKGLFALACASCHGDQGQGIQGYARYGRLPFVTISTRPMSKNDAGGTWMDFAERSGEGAHATLPDLTEVATYGEEDWYALQAYIATFKGAAAVTTDRPAKPVDALLFSSEAYDLYVKGGVVYKWTPGAEGAAASNAPVSNYADFRTLYTTVALPEAAPADLKVKGYPGASCAGQGCKGTDLSGQTTSDIPVSFSN